jgi:hypothetical protein
MHIGQTPVDWYGAHAVCGALLRDGLAVINKELTDALLHRSVLRQCFLRNPLLPAEVKPDDLLPLMARWLSAQKRPKPEVKKPAPSPKPIPKKATSAGQGNLSRCVEGKRGRLLKYEQTRKRWQERFAEADGRYLKLYTDEMCSELRTIVDLVDIILPDDHGDKSANQRLGNGRFELRQQKGKPLKLQAASEEEVGLWLIKFTDLRREARHSTTSTNPSGHPSIMPHSPLVTLMSEPFLSQAEACNLYIGLLEVTIIEAINLQPADSVTRSSDPYVTTQLTGYYQCFGDEHDRLTTEWCKDLRRNHSTKWVYRSLHPVWNSSFHVTVQRPYGLLKFQVYDHDIIGSDDFLGWCSCRLSDLMDDNEHDLLMPIHPTTFHLPSAIAESTPGSACAEEMKHGALRVRVRYHYNPKAHIAAGFYRQFPAGAVYDHTMDKFSADNICSHVIDLGRALQPLIDLLGAVGALLA